MVAIIIVAVVVLVVVLAGVGIYNNLVTLRNRVKNAFAQIDVQLKRRYDLIPNLVEVAKKYMEHERETLEAVVAARSQAVTANQQAAANPADPSDAGLGSGAGARAHPPGNPCGTPAGS